MKKKIEMLTAAFSESCPSAGMEQNKPQQKKIMSSETVAQL